MAQKIELIIRLFSGLITYILITTMKIQGQTTTATATTTTTTDDDSDINNKNDDANDIKCAANRYMGELKLGKKRY